MRHGPCGHPIDELAAFCPRCGRPTDQIVGTASASAPVDFLVAEHVSAVLTVEAPPQTAPAPAVSRSSRRRRWLIVAGVAAAVAFLAGTSVTINHVMHRVRSEVTAAVAPSTITITGTFVLHDYESAQAGCRGEGGYSDIQPGTEVIVTNEANVIIGSTTLGWGSAYGSDCTFTFSVADVSKEFAHYAVEVSHRGKVVNSRADMEANAWRSSLTLG